jgi:uncharacterized RDD family membrane protein YckC
VTQQPYGELPQYPQASAEYQTQQPAFQLPIAPDGRPLAGAGERLGARVIDTFAFLAVFMVLAGVLAGIPIALIAYLTEGDPPFLPVVGGILILVIVFGTQYLYEVEVPLRWNGQTPGKRVLKIAIAPLEPGAPLTRKALVYRYLVTLLFTILSNCYVGYLDPLWLLWDKPYKQALHDKPANTVVVKVAPAPLAAPR